MFLRLFTDVCILSQISSEYNVAAPEFLSISVSFEDLNSPHHREITKIQLFVFNNVIRNKERQPRWD